MGHPASGEVRCGSRANRRSFDCAVLTHGSAQDDNFNIDRSLALRPHVHAAWIAHDLFRWWLAGARRAGARAAFVAASPPKRSLDGAPGPPKRSLDGAPGGAWMGRQTTPLG
jgi:hypothetical protein